MRTASAILHPALVSAIAPHSTVAEEYRAIRARLTQHEDHSALRTIMITSPGGAEGKSVTAANLALAMAQEFQRRVVCRHRPAGPSVHATVRHRGRYRLAKCSPAKRRRGAWGLPPDAASPCSRPAHAAVSDRTARLGGDAPRARHAASAFDRVLLDLPAVMPLADVGTVAPLTDGVVMVIRAGVTQRPALDQALEALEDSKILGVVLNQIH